MTLKKPTRSAYRGTVLTLESGEYRASVTSVGATLNSLTLTGRDLIVPGSLDEPMVNYRGAVVAPWPNRLGEGRYTWDGKEYLVPLNEHERRTALHGLVSFLDFEVAEHDASSATLTLDMPPLTGYPFPLSISVRYELSGDGLRTTVRATNTGTADAPYGVCPHPYLVAGPDSLDTWTATIPARSVLEIDERLLPLDVVDAASHPEWNLQGDAPIGDRAVDHAFTDIDEGLMTVESSSGSGVGIEWDANVLGWLQVHTADHDVPEYHRVGLAVEPMTCAPDAFRTGNGLVRLQPEQTHVASWRIYGW